MVVEIPVRVFAELGLEIVSTPGGTPDAHVNRQLHEAFIETAAAKLATAATPVSGGEP